MFISVSFFVHNMKIFSLLSERSKETLKIHKHNKHELLINAN